MSENRSDTMNRSDLERALEEARPVLYHRLNSRFRDPQLADEVTGDCLTQAFERWLSDPGYFARHDLTTWSSRLAGWRVIDRLRDRGRHSPLPEEQGEEDPHGGALAVARTDPEVERRAADRLRTWEAVQALDERDRCLVLEHFYEGTSDQALGARLFGDKASAQALGLRIWRLRQKALGRLQQKLLEAGIDPEDWGGQAV